MTTPAAAKMLSIMLYAILAGLDENGKGCTYIVTIQLDIARKLRIEPVVLKLSKKHLVSQHTIYEFIRV
jgi:hypothetical protein